MNTRLLSLLLTIILIVSLPIGAMANSFNASTSYSQDLAQVFGEFNFDSTYEEKVIVEFTEDPVVIYQKNTGASLATVNSYESLLSSAQDSFAQSVKSKELDVTELGRYTTVFNGMAIQIPENQIEQLLHIPGVKAVYQNQMYQIVDSVTTSSVSATLESSAPLIGAIEAQDLGYDGTGIKIGILDTGVDFEHPY